MKTQSPDHFENSQDHKENKWEKLAEKAHEIEEKENSCLEQTVDVKYAELEQVIRENQDRILRLEAELQNTRQRMEKEKINAHKYAIEGFVNELLPVLDSLEQALISKGENEQAHHLYKGIELTSQMFIHALEKFGVESLSPHHEVFDPHYHEAVSMQPSEILKPNYVIKVVQKGYELNGRLVRPARVIVSQ